MKNDVDAYFKKWWGKDEIENLYSIKAICTNCGHTGYINIPRGTVVPQSNVCPNCDCSTFVKLWRNVSC